MKRIIALLITLLIAFPSLADKHAAKTAKRLKRLDTQLEALLSDWNVPGYAIAIVEKDRVIYAKGFGYGNIERRQLVTPNTLFPIASCSKAFTASMIGILSDEKRIDLNKNPNTYVPDLKFFNDEMNNQIRVSDLMSHRTGLPRHDAAWKRFPTFSSDTLLRKIQFMKPTAGVWEKYQYNNMMFFLQGLIVERVTSKSWEQNIAERFFAPLEMTRSNFSISDLMKDGDATSGYRLKGESETVAMDFFEMGAVKACGGINSCVNEMANWVIAWINGGKFKGRQIIPFSYLQQAISSQVVATSGLPQEYSPDVHLDTYGYAWTLASYRGHYKVEHSGNIDGSSALVAFYPYDSIGVVILTNQYSSGIRQVVMNLVSDKMLDLPAREWNKILLAEREKRFQKAREDAAKPDTIRKEGTSTSHALADFVGTFTNPAYGEIRIVERNDSLFAHFPRVRYWLGHYHYDLFKMYEITGSGIDLNTTDIRKINFLNNEDGELDHFTFQIESALPEQEFRRKKYSE